MERQTEINTIANNETIQQLAADCLGVERQIANERIATDFFLAAAGEADEEGRLCLDAVELSLRERLGDLTTVLGAVHKRRLQARVLEACQDGIIYALAEQLHDALQELAAESTPQDLIACGVAAADQGDAPFQEVTAAALYVRLQSIVAALAEIREYKSSCGTGCTGCQHWIDGACCESVYWASGAAPLNPHCYAK